MDRFWNRSDPDDGDESFEERNEFDRFVYCSCCHTTDWFVEISYQIKFNLITKFHIKYRVTHHVSDPG